MPESEQCPQAEMVARLIDGELSAEERTVLEEHISECRECYRLLTESTEVWWRSGSRPKESK